MSIDIAVADWMLHHRGAALDGFCRGLMWLGSTVPGFLVCAVLIVVIAGLRGRPWTVLGTGAAVFAAAVASLILKSLIQRPRPGLPYAQVATSGYSMPSTAAAMTAAGLLTLMLLAPPGRLGRALTALLLLAIDVAVSFAVVYLGAHWFTDVCVGNLLGVAIDGGLLLGARRLGRGTPRGRRRRTPRDDRARRRVATTRPLARDT